MQRHSELIAPAPLFRRAAAADTDAPTLPDSPVFGQHFTDHMVLIDWDATTGWHSARVVDYAPLSIDPAAAVLHYALEIFEGLKAYRHPNGTIHLFRPRDNARRFQKSAERLALPILDLDWFTAAAEQLVAADAQWIPRGKDASLYLRPFLIATDAFLGLRVPRKALFAVIASPTTPYFSDERPLRMWLSTEHTRAGRGGTGAAKCGGNYASSLLATSIAAEHGCDQVVFTDATTGTCIEEAGNMNLFLVTRDGSMLTPPVTPAAEGGTVLEGITRDSVIQIARRAGLRVEERSVTVDEWVEGIRTGDVTEAFATGTAAIVTPLGELVCDRGVIAPAAAQGIGPVAAMLRRKLTEIQFGFAPDDFGWMHHVETTP